jgi:hypothetical protein
MLDYFEIIDRAIIDKYRVFVVWGYFDGDTRQKLGS